MKLFKKLKSIKTKLSNRYTYHLQSGHYKRFSHIFLNVIIALDILFSLIIGFCGANSSNGTDNPKQDLLTSDVIRDINYSQDCSGMNVFDYLNIVGSTNIVKTNLSYCNRTTRLDISILSNPSYYIYLLDEQANIHKVSSLSVPTLAQHTNDNSHSQCIVHYKNNNDDVMVRLVGDNDSYWFITNYRLGSPFSTIPYTYFQEAEVYEKNLHTLAVNSLYMCSDYEPYSNIAPTRLSDSAYRFQVYTSGHTMTYTHNTFVGLFYSNNMLYDTLSYEWYNCRYYTPTNFGASVADYFTYNSSGNGHYDFFLKYMKFKTACSYSYIGAHSGETDYMSMSTINTITSNVCERQKTITSTGYIYSADCSYSFYNGQHATIKTLCAKHSNPQTDPGCLIDTPNLSSYLDVLKISPDSLGFGASSSLLTGLFGLLTEVFSPVGYFLGLELAPGFYLGYILFAPIVVACMVAIVKMIRS